MKLKIFCDGGARNNPGRAACGFVIKDETGQTLKTGSKYLGIATNNEAEYWAVVEALKAVMSYELLVMSSDRKVQVFLDSNLVASQLSGKFKMKNARLRELLLKVRELEAQIGNISYHHIPREQNAQADYLVNEELGKQLAKRD